MTDTAIKMLHLEDDPADAELVHARLAEAGIACRITRVRTRADFEAALDSCGVDIILADYHLPDYDGMSGLHAAHERCPRVPFIFVSGTMGEEVANEVLTRGATDYVPKDHLSRLALVVRRALREARNQKERKQAERSIRLLSQVVEQCPVSIMITDVEGRIEFVNAKFSQLTGYSSNEVLGRNAMVFKSGKVAQEEYRGLWKTIRSGGIWKGQFRNRKKSGEMFWEQATIAPVRNREDAITHFVAVKEDITERKQLQEQLRQSQKMEAIGQLAGGVAHDLNNMLGVIIGHAELVLGDEALDESLRDRLDKILKAGRRSTEITRQLLAFARKQTIVPKILDLNETIEEILKLLRRLIDENIELAWLPGSRLWPLKMDPSQIDQILANLCINARDAIGGAGKIVIETHKAVFDDAYCARHSGFTPGEYVMLAVSDDGGGMDKATKEKIFEPFFTTKEIGRGTGLGLATIYGIVKQNNGFINVYSEPERGTTFKIYLPRHTVAIPRKSGEISALQAPRGDETILVVEDEVMNLEMVGLILESFGYQVLTANTTADAVRLAGEHSCKIHLLLTDLIMPGMNGRELANEIIALCSGVLCLFMSGYTGDIIAHQGLLDEGTHFIQKPFAARELAVKVRQILDRKQDMSYH